MAVKKTQQIFRSMKSVLSSVYGLEVGMDSGCILVIVSPQMCATVAFLYRGGKDQRQAYPDH